MMRKNTKKVLISFLKHPPPASVLHFEGGGCFTLNTHPSLDLQAFFSSEAPEASIYRMTAYRRPYIRFNPENGASGCFIFFLAHKSSDGGGFSAKHPMRFQVLHSEAVCFQKKYSYGGQQ